MIPIIRSVNLSLIEMATVSAVIEDYVRSNGHDAIFRHIDSANKKFLRELQRR